MRKIYVVFILICAFVAGGAASVRLPSFDNFFRDWHQILANSSVPESPLRLIDITSLMDGPDKYSFSKNRLEEILNILSEQNPRSIGLTISVNEVEDKVQTVSLIATDKRYDNLWFLTTKNLFEQTSFGTLENQIPEEKRRYFLLTHDSLLDRISRRILVFYGKDQPNNDEKSISDLMGSSVSASEFVGTFEYLDSQQVYMKIWPREKWNILKPQNMEELRKISAHISDKVVLLGSLGRYSFNASPSIFRRAYLFGESNIDEEMVGAHELLGNYVLNWYSGSYIKSVGMTSKTVGIFFGLIFVIGSVLFLPVRRAWLVSSVFLVLYLFISFLAFKIFSTEIDSVRVLIIGLIAQYFILPLRFHKTVTKQAEEKFKSDARNLEDKLKARVMIQAASSDAHLRTAAKIAHDIRGPLSGLRVVQRFLGESVNPDAKVLFEDSINRIDSMAEGSLNRFRSGQEFAPVVDTDLQEVLSNLNLSYGKVVPSLRIESVNCDIKVPVPFYSLQRCFSNLIQNSIEACAAHNIAPVISFVAEDSDDILTLTIQDNGPGIPSEISNMLFRPRVTAGKKHGTGLGLLQVKEELLNFGAVITSKASSEGACFQIKFAKDLSALNIKVGVRCIVIGSKYFVSEVASSVRTAGGHVFSCESFQEARDTIKTLDQSLTIISELILEGQDETAFDLMDSFPEGTFDKAIFSTSLLNNSDIYALAQRRGVLLVSQAQVKGARYATMS